jgi:hypothetical protein
MATPLQQQALVRKLSYGAAILALLTGSLLLRAQVILPRANSLLLREETKGEVELTGSAIRLSLTGSRGVAICFLWIAAQEKQKKREWNEMELLVSSVAKLQPHFITPWLYQSWNIAFNVSYKSDSPHDKYFYISRGIQLLAEGERRNRGNKDERAGIEYPGSPDLRFHLGNYYQLKIGKSDESRTLRSLYQLSCIPLAERDPDYTDPNKEAWEIKDPKTGRRIGVNLHKFETFCQKHPRLVRRLREQLGCQTPESVIAFLRAHKKIPSRYEGNTTRLKKSVVDRFPILPPSSNTEESDFDDDDGQGSDLGDDFDNFAVARTWFHYAQQPLPPLDKDFDATGRTTYDPQRYRRPKMAHYVFREYPAIAQENIARFLAQEGWFDSSGWPIISAGKWPKWFMYTEGKKKGQEKEVLVGASDRYSSQRAWGEAHKILADYGERSWLRMPDAWGEWVAAVKTGAGILAGPSVPIPEVQKLTPPERLAKRYQLLQRRATLYKNTYAGKDIPPEGLSREHQKDRTMRDAFDATNILSSLMHARMVSNYRNHYYQAEAEATREAVAARKAYDEAEILYVDHRHLQAREKYQEWITLWRSTIDQHLAFRESYDIQEDTYYQQMRYLFRAQIARKPLFQQLFVNMAEAAPSRIRLPIRYLLTHSFPDPEDPDLTRWSSWQKDQLDRILPAYRVFGPFDRLAPDGRPYFPPEIVLRVRDRFNRSVAIRHGLKPKTTQPMPQQGPMGGPPQPMGE